MGTEIEVPQQVIDLARGAEVRPIPGFPGYFATEDGRIISIARWPIILKSWRTTGGYQTVGLRGRKVKIHRLIAITFLGEPPVGQNVVRHLDDNNQNNHISNLKWGTYKDNSQDAVSNGKIPVGEQSYLAQLTEQDVIEIRKRLSAGEHAPSISDDFPVSKWGILDIKKGRRWKHLCNERIATNHLRGEGIGNSKLTESDVVEIRELLSEGKLTLKKIAELYNVSPGLIGFIKTGAIWSHV